MKINTLRRIISAEVQVALCEKAWSHLEQWQTLHMRSEVDRAIENSESVNAIADRLSPVIGHHQDAYGRAADYRDAVAESRRAWAQVELDNTFNRMRMLAMFTDDSLTPDQRRKAVADLMKQDVL